MEGREAKDRLYQAFSQVAKAAASPARIELLELLAQTERSVDALAAATGMGVTNTSAHLQVLRRAGLVGTRKQGTRVHYHLADPQVAIFVAVLRDVARARLPEVDRVVHDYFLARDELEPMSRTELVERTARGEVVILDVRPIEEYVAGHIPGALSMPLGELDAALARLPKRRQKVAYCRGPYCVLAVEAVERLRAAGHRARRLEDGMPEWQQAGLGVTAGRR